MARKNQSIGEPLFPYDSQPEAPEEAARREVYRRRLAEYLQDPEFRAVEGFPIGSDEDILALSDPPYYTACPNPFLPEILEQWQAEREETRRALGLPVGEAERYRREPFAADVSEGKNDPIYNAHSYHTKVPHKAVMRYILHYTDPGDLVFDGFCGTGMTGVAAQLCGDKKAVEALGYTVKSDGRILDENGNLISRLGERKAVLSDLSPAATFIAYNYNTPPDARHFVEEATRVLKEVEAELGWMYETWHPNYDDPTRRKAVISSIIWSDIFSCPNCAAEMVFWDVAVDSKNGNIFEEWTCPSCRSVLSKNPRKNSDALKAERVQEFVYDVYKSDTIRVAKQTPVLIQYEWNGKRLKKTPDFHDLELIKKIVSSRIQFWFPTTRIDKDIDIWYERDYVSLGVYSVDQFFTRRNLIILASMWEKAKKISTRLLSNYVCFAITSMQVNLSRMNRWRANVSFPYNPLSGTLYLGALQVEANVITGISNKVKRLLKALSIRGYGVKEPTSLITTQSTAEFCIKLPENSVSYVFTDPPFGSNIIYSDLSIIWESWLKISTSTDQEAVVHRRKKITPTTLDKYLGLMIKAFKEMYRVLMPGHWITVEFHNTQNAVWNTIQEALLIAGFMVVDVRTLDKQQESFKQVSAANAVKQDLVISAFKPTEEFSREFSTKRGSESGAWVYIKQRLEQLPPPEIHDGVLRPNPERFPYLLYDRLIAFHLVQGLTVPLSSSDFYIGLGQRYLTRDGMYFTAAQAADYDRLRLKAERVDQLVLFITDEDSALQWLRQSLDPINGGKSKVYSDLQPEFLKHLHQEKYEKMPELTVMLEQNFLQDDEGRWYVPDPDKQADMEALRERALLNEFNIYLRSKGKLKAFRSEAVRAGFSRAWRERDYKTIVELGQRLPEAALQEDANLKMYYDNSLSRCEGSPQQPPLI